MALSEWRERRTIWACVMMTGQDEAIMQEAIQGNALPSTESASSSISLPWHIIQTLRSPLACVADTDQLHCAAVHKSYIRGKFRNCCSAPITTLEAVASSFVSSYGKPTAICVQVCHPAPGRGAFTCRQSFTCHGLIAITGLYHPSVWQCKVGSPTDTVFSDSDRGTCAWTGTGLCHAWFCCQLVLRCGAQYSWMLRAVGRGLQLHALAGN